MNENSVQLFFMEEYMAKGKKSIFSVRIADMKRQNAGAMSGL